MRYTTAIAAALLLGTFTLSACQGDNEPAPAGEATPAAAEGASPTPEPTAGGASPGKPTAPVSMQYDIIGKPVVGQPVLINVRVSSSQGPVSVSYTITDTSALAFEQGQVERLEIVDPSLDGVQQLSVVPQRAGRAYVNVSAEVQTPMGTMIRSMAIPIEVAGGAPGQKPVENGEAATGPDGEAVISLPAEESDPR